MGILRTNKISGLGTDGTVFQGVTRFDTQGYFVAPSGTTDQRNAGITTTDGTIRFNTDSQKLEFYAQSQWWEMVIDTPALGVAADTGAGARGVFGTKETPGVFTNTIEYINIASAGNALDFGDLSEIRRFNGSCSSSTRGLYFGGTNPGSTPGLQNDIDYITISSTGNTTVFGTLSDSKRLVGGVSNSTRGVFAGGRTPTYINVIEYVTIAATGNAVDFGDLTAAKEDVGGCGSSTRGLFLGGSGPTSTNVIEFITIGTLGNAQDFGDLNAAGGARSSCCSNSIRGIRAGADPRTNNIEYITIATLGNTADFGDLPAARNQSGAAASSTRAVFFGGYIAPAYVNTIEYVTISTQGNAVDFGDTNGVGVDMAGLSNAHGGL